MLYLSRIIICKFWKLLEAFSLRQSHLKKNDAAIEALKIWKCSKLHWVLYKLHKWWPYKDAVNSTASFTFFILKLRAFDPIPSGLCLITTTYFKCHKHSTALLFYSSGSLNTDIFTVYYVPISSTLLLSFYKDLNKLYPLGILGEELHLTILHLLWAAESPSSMRFPKHRF